MSGNKSSGQALRRAQDKLRAGPVRRAQGDDQAASCPFVTFASKIMTNGVSDILSHESGSFPLSLIYKRSAERRGQPQSAQSASDLHFAPFKFLLEPAGVEALAGSLTQNPPKGSTPTLENAFRCFCQTIWQVKLSCKDLGGLGVRIFGHPLRKGPSVVLQILKLCKKCKTSGLILTAFLSPKWGCFRLDILP
jgi:hypothetical protein